MTWMLSSPLMTCCSSSPILTAHVTRRPWEEMGSFPMIKAPQAAIGTENLKRKLSYQTMLPGKTRNTGGCHRMWEMLSIWLKWSRSTLAFSTSWRRSMTRFSYSENSITKRCPNIKESSWRRKGWNLKGSSPSRRKRPRQKWTKWVKDWKRRSGCRKMAVHRTVSSRP